MRQTAACSSAVQSYWYLSQASCNSGHCQGQAGGGDSVHSNGERQLQESLSCPDGPVMHRQAPWLVPELESSS